MLTPKFQIEVLIYHNYQSRALTFHKNYFYSFQWKILFISCQKLFSFLRYLHFCTDFLVMGSQTGQQLIILSNISRIKDNQTMKLGQLIKHTIRNIFLENHIQNVVEKLVPDSFIKNQNWAYLWIKSLKSFKAGFCCISKSRSTKIY